MEPITTELQREERSDIARRFLKLDGAAPIEYIHQGYTRGSGMRGYGGKAEQPRAMLPTRLSIVWTQGKLHGFTLAGPRLKKDGTPGRIQDTVSFKLKAHGWEGSLAYGQPAIAPPDWLLQLVEQHKDNVPAFDADR